MTATPKSENGSGDVNVAEGKQDLIAAQIEYYFSDVNLRKDKFLKEKIAEKEGWVDIETLLTFNRLKSLAGDSVKSVVEALKSTVVGKEDSLLELNEESTAIRRTAPLVELNDEQRKELENRTIHFKGIPRDAQLDEIRAFCSQYGKVLTVEMRRRREDKVFKGCVMCVYDTQDDADRALKGTEAYDPDIKFLRETKTQYWIRKKDFIEQRKSERRGNKPNSDVKKEDEDADPVKVKDAVLLLENVDTNAVQFKVIKDFFKQFGDVKYVDMQEEPKRALIRFNTTEEAANVLKNNPAEVSIDKNVYPISLLTGEEEVNFWKSVNSALKNAVSKDKHAHRSKGRGFKRGGGGYKGNNDRFKSRGNSDRKRGHDETSKPLLETPSESISLKKAKQDAE